MSGGGLKWFLGLDDHLSGDAKKAAEEVEQLEKKMHALRTELERTEDKALQGKLRSRLSSLQVEKIGWSALSAGHGSNEKWSRWVETLDHGLHLMEMMGEVAKKVGETIYEWSREVVHAAGEKQRQFFSFRSMIGDADAAKEVMDRLERLSGASPLGEDELLGYGRKLLAGGFKLDEVPVYLKAISDAAAVTGASSEKVDGAVDALNRINREGALAEKTMKALSLAGVPAAKVYAILGEDLHVTADAARALVKKGQITANEGLWAAVAAVKEGRSGGRLGSAGEAAVDESSELLLAKIRQKLGNTFEDIWDTKGFSKWMGFLRNLNHALDDTTESGRRLREAVGGAFDNLFEGLFGEFSGPNGLKGAEELVLKFSRMVESAGIAVNGLASGFMSAISPMFKGGGFFDFSKDLTPEKIDALKASFEHLGYTAGVVVEKIAKLVELISRLGPFTGLGAEQDMYAEAWRRSQRQTQALQDAQYVKALEPLLDADVRTLTRTPAPTPSVTAAQVLSTTQSTNASATVHQVFNIAGAADPRAIGEAAEDGARRGTALTSRELVAHALGAVQ